MKIYLSFLFTCINLMSYTSADFPQRGVGPPCADNNRETVRPCTLSNNKPGVCARECLTPKLEYTEICCHMKQANAFEVYYCCEKAIPADPRGYGPIYNSDLQPREFPYLGALGWFYQRKPKEYLYRCTSVAISSRFLLTAAHCAVIYGYEAIVVRLGGVHRLEPIWPVTIKKIFIHPDYNDFEAYNDIALVQLVGNYRGLTIKHWTELNYPNTSFVAAGYGNTTSRGLSSQVVLKNYLKYVANDECALDFQNKEILPNGISETQICGKVLKNISETCQGNSGGPLIMTVYANNYTKRTDYLIGITSFGDGCGSSPPVVYTRVSAYIDWINEVMLTTTNTTLNS